MARGRKKETRRLRLTKLPELLADQMKCDVGYVLDIMSDMVNRLEAKAHKEQNRMKASKSKDDPAALAAASEYYIFVYVLNILDSLVDDIEIKDIHASQDELLAVSDERKKMMN